MNNQHDIERQEREFQELLQKVMKEPLAPVTNSVLLLDKRLNEFEGMLQDLQATTQGANMTADDALLQLRLLKSLTEEAPREFRQSLQPMMREVQSTLEQSTLVAHRDSVEQLSGQLAQQSESGQQSFGRLQALMVNHKEELGTQAVTTMAESARLVAAQMESLSDILAQLQMESVAQRTQLNSISQQQQVWAAGMSEQLIRSTQSLRNWMIVCVVLAASGGAATIAALVARV